MVKKLTCIVEDRSFALLNDFFKREVSVLSTFDEAIEGANITCKVLTVVESNRLSANSWL